MRKCFLQVLASKGLLCPALRRMPQAGSILTELAVSFVLFARMPITVVVNGVYIFKRWSDGDGDRCPLVTRGHSAVLGACGVAPLSLKEFFDSTQRVNLLLFRTLGIVANALENSDVVDGRTVTFVNGIKIAAENLFYPLHDQSPQGAVTRMMALPVVESLGKGLVGTLAKYNVIPIAGAALHLSDFMYHLLLDTAYGTLQGLRRESFGSSLGSALVLAVYENEHQYREIVTMQLLKACTGLSLTLGYTNPQAVFLRHSCNAFAAVPSDLYSFVNTFLVDIPTVRCMCKDSVGYNFKSYVMSQCYADAPGSLKPLIWATVYSSTQHQDVCRQFLSYTVAKLKRSLDPFFSELYLASDGVGGSVDYIFRKSSSLIRAKLGGRGESTTAADSAAAAELQDTCSNYQTNPFVVAVIPEPVDYFRPCGYIKMCRTRCGVELDAFYEAAAADAAAVTRREYLVSCFISQRKKSTLCSFSASCSSLTLVVVGVFQWPLQ